MRLVLYTYTHSNEQYIHPCLRVLDISEYLEIALLSIQDERGDMKRMGRLDNHWVWIPLQNANRL